MNNKATKKLIISSFSWPKGNLHLIDYDEGRDMKKNVKISKATIINSKDDEEGELEIVDNIINNNKESNQRNIVRIDLKDDAFYVSTNICDKKLCLHNQLLKGNCAWLVYHKEFDIDYHETVLDTYKVKVGEILKIGRVFLLLREIKFPSIKNDDNNNLCSIKSIESCKSNNESPTISVMAPETINRRSSLTKVKPDSICRICFSKEIDNISDPLIRPCDCSGSSQFIHYLCLKHWIDTQLHINDNNTDNCIIYVIKQLKCEICKEIYPKKIKHNNKFYNLFEYKVPYDSYIQFESISVDGNNYRYKYFVKFNENKEMTIGQNESNNMIIADYSVSDEHAKLSLVNKSVYLEDLYSKYGTLVLIQNPEIKILDGQKLNIQTGKWFIGISYEESGGFWSCCNVKDIDYSITYGKMNGMHVKSGHKFITDEEYDQEIIKDNSVNDSEIAVDNKEIESIIKENGFNIKHSLELQPFQDDSKVARIRKSLTLEIDAIRGYSNIELNNHIFSHKASALPQDYHNNMNSFNG